MIKNQLHINNLQVETKTELETVSGGYCFCTETNTLYKFVIEGSTYEVDNFCVINTREGGNTRWVGVAGKFAILKGSHVSHIVGNEPPESTVYAANLLTPNMFYSVDTSGIIYSDPDAYNRAHGVAKKSDSEVFVSGRSGSFTHFYNLPNINDFTRVEASIPTSEVFEDWYLPSLDELSEMYDDLHLYGLGSFSSNLYWTSSEVTDNTAYAFSFNTGIYSDEDKSSSVYAVRPIRSFIGEEGDYAVRDEGPASGPNEWNKTYIFFIEDLGGTSRRFYESAPQSAETYLIWSDPNSEIGTSAQGTSIGDGQGNTDSIVNWLLNVASPPQIENRAALYVHNLSYSPSPYMNFTQLDSVVYVDEDGVDVCYAPARRSFPFEPSRCSILKFTINPDPTIPPEVEEFLFFEDFGYWSETILTDGEHLYLCPRYQHTGTYAEATGYGLVIRAEMIGEEANIITLAGDGVSTIQQLINNQNLIDPTRPIYLESGDPNYVLDDGVPMPLSGGTINTSSTDAVLLKINIATKVVESTPVSFEGSSHAGCHFKNDSLGRHEGYLIWGGSLLKIDFTEAWPGNVTEYSSGLTTGQIHDDATTDPEGKYLYWSSEPYPLMFRFDIQEETFSQHQAVRSYCVESDGQDLYMTHNLVPQAEQGFVKFPNYDVDDMQIFALGIPELNELFFDDDYIYGTIWFGSNHGRLVRIPKEIFTVAEAELNPSRAHKAYIIIPEDTAHDHVTIRLPKASALDHSIDVVVVNNSSGCNILVETENEEEDRDVFVRRFGEIIEDYSYNLQGQGVVKFSSTDGVYHIVEEEGVFYPTIINVETGLILGAHMINTTLVVTHSEVFEAIVTIPHNDTISLPVGSKFRVMAGGTGGVEFVPEADVTINSLNGLKLNGQYAHAIAEKVSENNWLVYGNTTT